jgi:hypothetical protein
MTNSVHEWSSITADGLNPRWSGLRTSRRAHDEIQASSDQTTVVEHYMRHGNLLSHVLIINDPSYLTESFVNSQEFMLMDRGNQNGLYNCEVELNRLCNPKSAAFLRAIHDLPYATRRKGRNDEALWPKPRLNGLSSGSSQVSLSPR